MMASFDEPYETSRLRHAAEAAALFPAYIARLRWTRADIDREQTRALRALVTHAAVLRTCHIPCRSGRPAGACAGEVAR